MMKGQDALIATMGRHRLYLQEGIPYEFQFTVSAGSSYTDFIITNPDNFEGLKPLTRMYSLVETPETFNFTVKNASIPLDYYFSGPIPTNKITEYVIGHYPGPITYKKPRPELSLDEVHVVFLPTYDTDYTFKTTTPDSIKITKNLENEVITDLKPLVTSKDYLTVAITPSGEHNVDFAVESIICRKTLNGEVYAHGVYKLGYPVNYQALNEAVSSDEQFKVGLEDLKPGLHDRIINGEATLKVPAKTAIFFFGNNGFAQPSVWIKKDKYASDWSDTFYGLVTYKDIEIAVQQTNNGAVQRLIYYDISYLENMADEYQVIYAAAPGTKFTGKAGKNTTFFLANPVPTLRYTFDLDDPNSPDVFLYNLQERTYTISHSPEPQIIQVRGPQGFTLNYDEYFEYNYTPKPVIESAYIRVIKAEEKSGSKAGVIAAVIIVLIILGVAGGVAYWWFFKRNKSGNSAAAAEPDTKTVTLV